MRKFIVYAKNLTCDLMSICFYGSDVAEARALFKNKLEQMTLRNLTNHHYLSLAEVDLTEDQLTVLSQIELDSPISMIPSVQADDLTVVSQLVKKITTGTLLLAEAVTSFQELMLPSFCRDTGRSELEIKQELVGSDGRSVKMQIIQAYFEKYYN